MQVDGRALQGRLSRARVGFFGLLGGPATEVLAGAMIALLGLQVRLWMSLLGIGNASQGPVHRARAVGVMQRERRATVPPADSDTYNVAASVQAARG